MRDSVVVCAFYNRTGWLDAADDEGAIDRIRALIGGEYIPTHQYDNVWGAVVGPDEDIVEWVFRQCQTDFNEDLVRREERSMSVGDLVVITHCDASPIAAYVCQAIDWKAIPEFFDRRRS